MKKIVNLFLLLIYASFLLSCSSVIYETVYPTLNDGRYDSEFPYRNSSEQLEEISQTIKLINSIAFYTSYIFDENSGIRLIDLKTKDIKEIASSVDNFSQEASGTGTVIYYRDGKTAILTCAHIVSFPDTIITYFYSPEGEATEYVQSFSIKKRQTIFTLFPFGGELDVILNNESLDVAVLTKKFSQEVNIPVFNYPNGKARELEWGSFVYAFGFPANYKMVSKGLVSSPNRDNDGSFLIDAVFNRGSSGGIVLAVRDGVPNFELVGIIRSAPAEFEYVLKPSQKIKEFSFNPLLPFDGNLYVEKQVSIKFGITKVIPIEAIIQFIKENKDLLISKGYYLDKFF